MIKYIISFVVLIGLLGCSKNSKKEADFVLVQSESSQSTSEVNVIGKWNLKKIHAPWNIEEKSKEEVWEFTNSKKLIISNRDSIVLTTTYSTKKELNGFSSASTFVLQADFENYGLESTLDIWQKDNEMELLEQCDDCYSLELEKLKQ